MSGGPVAALPLDEIQGLVLSGYGDRPAASYGLFEIVDRARAAAWIGRLVPRLQFGEYRRTPRLVPPLLADVVVNIAFTHEGLAALGLDPVALAGFSLPFQEGAADPHRARRLGDDGPSDPSRWTWGGPESAQVHGLLAVFAGHRVACDDDLAETRDAVDGQLCEANGVRLVRRLDALPVDRVLRKEHFGFRDGISNPRLASLSRSGTRDVIADGEFVLGYANGYGRLPLSPEVPAARDRDRDLPPSSTDPRGRRDFGKNGSYLVFRQLAQDVAAFWRHVYGAAPHVPEAPPGDRGAAWLAAKMVGRWPNGTALTRHPSRPGPTREDDENAFLYAPHDAFGERCPIGSHVRRTNPRDTALPVPHDIDLSGDPNDPEVRDRRLGHTALHRVLRRGRPYGAPLDPHYDPAHVRARGDDAVERGLYFLCFNANLARQFEFVQSNWAISPTFAGLSRDPDPLLGAGRTCPFVASDFTLQGLPPRRVRDLPRVVETRGAAYFFMPSKSALVYLSRGLHRAHS